MKLALICFSLALSLGASPFTGELRILSWNTFLLPEFVNLVMDIHQEERIPHIADFINKGAYDIVALQEVFTEVYYKKLKSRLKEKYPHDTGLPFRTWYKPVNSGLVVFSKLPLSQKKFFPFQRLRHADMFSSKGIQKILVHISKDKTVHVVNTHFQARPEHGAIRKEQLKLLEEKVLKGKAKEEVVVLAGDFNIDQKTTEYKGLLKSGGVSPMRLLGPLFFTTDSEINTFRSDGRRELIDYIFVRGARVKEQRILNPTGAYATFQGASLSDHQPVETIMEIKKPD